MSAGEEHAGAPDARLTELLRAATAAAYPALQELRARHHPSVLAYARLCTTSESSARRLAAQTFTTAARDTARGMEPPVPWRHQLLLLAAVTAADWAGDERSAGVDPGLLLILNTTGAPGGPTPPLLAAFRTLPSRTQGLIWYGVLEREDEGTTAAFLGLTGQDVRHGTPQALQAMAKACLRSRLAASDDPRCGDFRRLIEESVRPDNPRRSGDLYAHMAHCPHCAGAHEDLVALRDTPRSALADGLLPWAGGAYAGRDAPPAGAADLPASPDRRSPRRLLLPAAALGVALTPLLVLLLSPSGSHGQRSAGATPSSSNPPVTVTVPAPPASPSPSPSAPAKSPSPSATSRPPVTPSAEPRPAPRRTSAPTPSPPGGAFAQVVNAADGRCLDVRDAYFDNGTDVVTVTCSSSPTQRWRVDAGREIVQSAADPDFCLDSRGDVDRGVGIWECDSVDGDHGVNLRFTVDFDGVIRPAIATGTAVTPDGGSGVSLEPFGGGAEQRWRAGAR
ncbi:ricin-type beta-trefoil lectin domain protein [Streptomyces sp. NPDC086787]|uniref:ricin-type beta-trefoil lectin domain protein n=1 Tax=Streptomyces sp. NPDC086787 TaxID=3365759 RepID=UPI003808ED3B